MNEVKICGVEITNPNKLIDKGIKEGETVRIGDLEFDFVW